ncbi:MAG: hypothetical protein RIC56_15715 [Pseudomonadales bacterium]
MRIDHLMFGAADLDAGGDVLDALFGARRHPSADLAPRARLRALTLGSPGARDLESLTAALALPVQVEASVQPVLRAELELPSGRAVVLESSPRTVALRFG